MTKLSGCRQIAVRCCTVSDVNFVEPVPWHAGMPAAPMRDDQRFRALLPPVRGRATKVLQLVRRLKFPLAAWRCSRGRALAAATPVAQVSVDPGWIYLKPPCHTRAWHTYTSCESWMFARCRSTSWRTGCGRRRSLCCCRVATRGCGSRRCVWRTAASGCALFETPTRQMSVSIWTAVLDCRCASSLGRSV